MQGASLVGNGVMVRPMGGRIPFVGSFTMTWRLSGGVTVTPPPGALTVPAGGGDFMPRSVLAGHPEAPTETHAPVFC